MALIAHYPLNGDTKDYSGNGRDLTEVGTIAYAPGVIGNALNVNRQYLTSAEVSEYLHGKPEASIAMWVKKNDLSYGIFQLSGFANTNGNLYPYQTNDKVYMDTFRTNRIGPITVTNVNEWHHLVITQKPGPNGWKLYQNGFLVTQQTANATVSANYGVFEIGRNSGARYANGLFNDIRIYDHALSEKEIKELAKAKVLHYKFDPSDEPTTNVWSGNLGIYNNYRLPATLVDTGKTYKGAKILRLGMTVDSANSTRLAHFRGTLNSHGLMGGSMTFLANTKYAASILWRPVNKSDVVVGGTASNISGWVSKGSTYEGDGWNRFTVVRTGTVTTNQTDNMFFSFCCPSMQLNETVFVEFCAPQVEVGKDYSTPYVLGTRHGGVKDSSGFGNDGTVAVATAPSWSEDSPAGRGSMEFSGGKFITLPNMLGSDEQITVCAWFKTNGLGGDGYHIIFGGTEVELDVTSAGQARFGLNVNNVRQVHNHSSGLADGKWHHICGVYDGAVKRVYVDGVLVGSDPVVGKIKNNLTRRVGVFGTQTNYHANGNISDVRIYGTALTPADIKELYQTRASIDNVGNLHAYESDEVSGDTPSITSQGIAKFSSINEVGRPVRYIRDWSNGSTSNTNNHWVEIQAIDPSGTNVALGKSSPSELITDGSTASNPYYSAGSGLKSVTVDLGDTYNITYLHIWQYWSDRRTYHNTKTEVSTDGTNWVTVFDSTVEGEYAESPEGKKILLYPDKVSIDSDGNIYTIEILEN